MGAKLAWVRNSKSELTLLIKQGCRTEASPDEASVVHHVCHELGVVARFRKLLLDMLELVPANRSNDRLRQRLCVLLLRKNQGIFLLGGSEFKYNRR